MVGDDVMLATGEGVGVSGTDGKEGWEGVAVNVDKGQGVELMQSRCVKRWERDGSFIKGVCIEN